MSRRDAEDAAAFPTPPLPPSSLPLPSSAPSAPLLRSSLPLPPSDDAGGAAPLASPAPSSSIGPPPPLVSSSSSPASPSSSFRSSLQLTMYRNQVAGHSPLFWHSGTICKPLIRSEYEFYAGLERDMPAFVPFVPKFYGLLDLEQLTEEMASSIVSSSGGEQTAEADDDDKERERESNYSAAVAAPAPESKERGGEDGLEEKEAAEDGFDASAPPPASSLASAGMTANHNAWSSHKLYSKWAMKCSQRKTGAASKQQIQYIVLEDLTYAYAKPCILDLKVGTRQHADSEPPSKIASKTARCLHTTSSTLGLRLCGMQVYHPTNALYLFRDKYYGRSLDAAGFERSLHDFFFDGERLVEEVVRAFIGRMERMRRAVVLWTKGRRFYSSSLLLVYEGDRKSRGEGEGERLERSAAAARQESDGAGFSQAASPHCTDPPPPSLPSASQPQGGTEAAAAAASSPSSAFTPTSLSQTSPSPPSQSAAFVRSSLPSSLSSSALSASLPSSGVTGEDSASGAVTQAPLPSSASSASSSAAASPPPPPPVKVYSHKRKTTHAQAMALARQRGHIDVRIIDFAHTSVVEGEQGGRAENDREAVDGGLLFGFDHLLALLHSLLLAAHPHHHPLDESQSQLQPQPESSPQTAAQVSAARPDSGGETGTGEGEGAYMRPLGGSDAQVV